MGVASRNQVPVNHYYFNYYNSIHQNKYYNITLKTADIIGCRVLPTALSTYVHRVGILFTRGNNLQHTNCSYDIQLCDTEVTLGVSDVQGSELLLGQD